MRVDMNTFDVGNASWRTKTRLQVSNAFFKVAMATVFLELEAAIVLAFWGAMNINCFHPQRQVTAVILLSLRVWSQ